MPTDGDTVHLQVTWHGSPPNNRPVCCVYQIPRWCSVVQLCLTLWPQGPQHTWLPCPSLFLRVCSNSFLLSWWCHPTISSSVVPFSSCPQSFPASGSFPVSGLFTSGGQNIGASASASVLPMNIQGWFSFKIDWVDPSFPLTKWREPAGKPVVSRLGDKWKKTENKLTIRWTYCIYTQW